MTLIWTHHIRSCQKKFKEVLLYGTGDEKLSYVYTNRNGDTQNRNHTFEGIINNLERRYRETQSEWIKEKMEKYMRITTCPSCEGKQTEAMSFWQ